MVFFYFQQLKLLSLPDLIFNLTVQKNNKDKEKDINLFYEWDGCFLSKQRSDISLDQSFILPFNKEKTFRIFLDSIIDEIDKKNKEKFLVRNNSLIFIEVKTHFPKKEEKDKNQNLENIIKKMFIKLNYYLELYLNILKNEEINNIQIILLYNQNRLTNYKNNIFEYINKYKSDLNNNNKLKQYNIFFDLFYIFPSIGKLSLNFISN